MSMNLEGILSKKNSIENIRQIINYLEKDKKLFATLIDLFFHGDIRTIQKVSGIITYCAEKKHFLIEPYIEKMLLKLQEENSNTLTRNLLRILQFVDIPEKFLGIIFDICYKFVGMPNTAIAIKAFSMTILYNICKKEPDLKNEVRELIKLQLEYGSKGVVARGKFILKKLEKNL